MSLKTPLPISLLFLLLLLTTLISSITPLKITSLQRDISLQTHVIREKWQLSLGNDENGAIKEFFVSLPSGDAASSDITRKLARVVARTAAATTDNCSVKRDATKNRLEIILPKPLPVKDSLSVTISFTYLNLLTPKPSHISQNQDQKLLYETGIYATVPYQVAEETVIVRLPNGNAVERYTDVVAGSKAQKRANTIKYGPFKNVKPNINDNPKISIHFQNNFPFVRIEKLERLLELSMWGNLAVEEKYVIRHSGAQLEGGFSRLDYTKGNPSTTAPSSFRSLTAKLPSIHAADVYYRDRIGNISTSTCRASSNGRNLEVEIQPRYPMMGGWKSTFTLGYNVPLSEFLVRDGSNYRFNYTFGTPFPEAPIDEYELKILIPEGSKNIQLDIPESIREIHTLKEHIEVFKTYLDTTGRPLIVTNKRNVAPESSQDYFALRFEFSRTSVLHEPLLVIGALFTICVITMLYVRFDVKIAKTPTQIKREQQSRAHELVEKYVTLQVERDQLYARLEKAFSMMKRSDNVAPFTEEQKRVDEARASISSKVAEIQTQLRAFKCDDVVAHIATIEQKEEDKLAKIYLLGTMQKRHIQDNRKMNEAEIEKLEKQYDNYTDDINAALEALV